MITFGHAFFMVDKYCDWDFGFSFARKLNYKEIKTTTLVTPNSHRNKTVSTYVNYNELEFDSGSSFAKLKASVDIPENFTLYKPAVEFGTSIKFSITEESLDTVLELIVHIETMLNTQEDCCRIPLFSKVSDPVLIERLNQRFFEEIRQNPTKINIAELDIIGATEVFNHNDCEFDFKYGRMKKHTQSLSEEAIRDFCTQFGLNYADVVLDISVVCYCNENSVVTKAVKELIDYTDDEECCILSKGIWYKYNKDYLACLKDSIAQIHVEYHPEYDFDNNIYDNFIEGKYLLEKNELEYVKCSETEIKKSLRKKYYAERAFNLIREEQDGFSNFDRNPQDIEGHLIESMDLYRDGMMCSVKIGNSSGKLCYAIDQSLTALSLYKKGLLTDCPPVSKVVLWFVLERATHVEDENGRPDINKLGMLMLKNRLDQWKKEVRLAGYQPLIYINYRNG